MIQTKIYLHIIFCIHNKCVFACYPLNETFHHILSRNIHKYNCNFQYKSKTDLILYLDQYSNCTCIHFLSKHFFVSAIYLYLWLCLSTIHSSLLSVCCDQLENFSKYNQRAVIQKPPENSYHEKSLAESLNFTDYQ